MNGARQIVPALLAWVLALPAGAAGEGGAELPAPGTRIDHGNLARYRHLLPEFAVRWIRDGGWFGDEARVVLPVGHSRPAPLPPSFLAATQRHAGGVRLREDGLVEGWVAGLPFPDPQPPQLGAKIMWNQYYRWRGDDTVIDSYRTLQVDRRGNRRETRGVFELLTVSGRTDRGDGPALGANPRGLRTVSRLIFTHPSSSRWQTTLVYRYEDSTRDDDVYVYLPTTRRVLRVQGGQRCTPVRGSDFTPDDFFGFDGRVWEHDWRVIGEGKTLALVHQQHVPTQLSAHEIWPAEETWELRDVWIVEGVPKNPGYCYGRRRLWIDRETFFVLHADVWDPNDVYWKGFLSSYAHTEVGNGEPAPVWAGTGAYDFQSAHSTYVTVGPPELGGGYRIDQSDLEPTDFTPNALLRIGR